MHGMTVSNTATDAFL